jgi:predicted ATPase
MKQFGSFGLDTSNECLWRNGLQISLPPKPFSVLRFLVENPGRLITHDELLDALWPETYVQPQVLRTYMLELRKILGDDAGQPQFIQTLPKRGYRFVAPVIDAVGIGNSATGAIETQAEKATGIVDRIEALARLEAQARLAAQGQRQLVFVTGGAGIGKTALADAFSLQACTLISASVVRGQCVEGLGNKENCYPVMEALSQLCSSTDGARACQILASLAPAWLPPAERLTGTIRAPDSSPISERTPGDLCGALEEMTQERLLILVLEDLQWADEFTLDLLSAVARRRAPAKLMVLATCRPKEGYGEHPLKALKQDLLIHRVCTEIALVPLAKTAVRDLLSWKMGQDALPTGLDTYVYQHSEGIPLYVLALLEHLIAQHFLARKGPKWSEHWEQLAPFPEIEDGVPEELGQLVELEIARRAPKEQRVLEAASLMRVAFPAWAVAAALEDDLVEIEEACDELALKSHFVRRAGHDELPDGTRSGFYVFAHGLYREVLYQRQSPARRAKAHIRIAERLRELFAGREGSVARETAMHYEAAGDWQRAAGALRAAAGYAHQRQAYSEVVQLLEHALDMAENLGDQDRNSLSQELRRELAIVHHAIDTKNRESTDFEKV